MTNMIYPLKLILPPEPDDQPNPKSTQILAKLESYNNLEERLIYYNNEVKSLAAFHKDDTGIFYWSDNTKFKVFCKCEKCKLEPGFESQENVYQKVRSKEVERLLSGIHSLNSYKEKLSFLFNTKGFHPDYTPAIYVETQNKPLEHLGAKTKAEVEIYNNYVIEAFERKYRIDGCLNDNYPGFHFENEKVRIDNQLDKIPNKSNRDDLLNLVLSEIENHYNYNPRQQPTTNSNSDLTSTLKYLDFGSKSEDIWFQKMIFGIEIDLNVQMIGVNSILRHTHISEIAKFYQYIKGLINGHKAPKPSIAKPDKKTSTTLSDLITHVQSDHIAEGIQIHFKNINGKRLKLLLLALQELNLLPQERFAKRFHECCKAEFNWDVSSYNAMNAYKFNDITDQQELSSIKQTLQTLIKIE